MGADGGFAAPAVAEVRLLTLGTQTYVLQKCLPFSPSKLVWVSACCSRTRLFLFNSAQPFLFCLHGALSHLRLPTPQRSQQDKLCLRPFCGEG